MVWCSWDLTGRFPSLSRSQMLSPKINLFSISLLIQFIFWYDEDFKSYYEIHWVTNKVGISSVLFFKKFEGFNFRWLRQTFQQFISHRKASFRQLIVSSQDHVNHRNPVDHVFIKFCCKWNFGGLGECTNGSLATEIPTFSG